jgi:hypothetical protein
MRSGMGMRMVLSDGAAAAVSQPDQTLIRTIARALRWWQRLSSEPELTPTSLPNVSPNPVPSLSAGMSSVAYWESHRAADQMRRPVKMMRTR